MLLLTRPKPRTQKKDKMWKTNIVSLIDHKSQFLIFYYNIKLLIFLIKMLKVIRIWISFIPIFLYVWMIFLSEEVPSELILPSGRDIFIPICVDDMLSSENIALATTLKNIDRMLS